MLHHIQWDRYAHKIRTWPGKTALICFNDLQAITAMKQLRAFGLEPGINYGLSGYDRPPQKRIIPSQIVFADTL